MCPIGVPSFGSRSLWISNTRSAGEKSGFPRSMSRSNGPSGSNTVTCVSPGARVAPNDTIGAPTSAATRAAESTATIARLQDLVILPLTSVLERALLGDDREVLQTSAYHRLGLPTDERSQEPHVEQGERPGERARPHGPHRARDPTAIRRRRDLVAGHVGELGALASLGDHVSLGDELEQRGT